jgi:hypothetical protein
MSFAKNEEWKAREEANKEKLKIEKQQIELVYQGKLSQIKLEAAERERLTPVCHRLYRSTIDKKTSDLTVREAQQVSACRLLELYQ